MPPGAATVGTDNLPPVCQIRNWVVFGPGYHKGTLYSVADCLEMGRNFQRLSKPVEVQFGAEAEPYLEPAGKIGHDQEQQLNQSLGFPRIAGTVTELRVAPDGLVSIDLEEVPTEFGALLNAGRWKDGSVEIAPPLPDPDDQAKKLYPVLTGVSFLGDEQPAVPVRYPIPKATFADGREVPPEYRLTPLAQALAEVSRNFAAKRPAGGSQFTYRGQTYSATAICFSAMTPLPGKPMTPEQLEKMKAAMQSAGCTPEQIEACAKACGAACGAAMAITPPPEPAPTPPQPGDPMTGLKQYADDPNTPPFAKALMSAFSAFAADCTKRMSATEAAVGDFQKTKPEIQAAAAFSRDYDAKVKADFRKRVESAVDDAILSGRIEARDRATFVNDGMTKSDTQTFAAGHAHAGKTEFQVWRDDLLARKPSHMFKPEIEEPKPGDAASDPFVRATLAQLGPKGQAALAAAAS